MRVVKAQTKQGQILLARANCYQGTRLNDVYDSWSAAKEHAYYWCYTKCIEEDGVDFHITSHNTFGFCVAWESPAGVRIETPKNSYLVVRA